MNRELARLALIFLVICMQAGQTANAIAPPELRAKAWVLLDASSEQVLAAHEPDLQLEPASLTKLMSAALVFKALKFRRLTLEQTLTPSAKAVGAPGAGMHLVAGTPVSVEDLLQGMLVVSANDATLTLAEAVSGGEVDFVKDMNEEARRLGLSNTHFVTPTGHSAPGHRSTAKDLARLAASLVRDYPDLYPRFGRREHSHRGIRHENRNRLLWLDPTIDGIKTGQTEAAGWCLAASAVRGPRRLIAILLGAPSETARVEEGLRLLNYGFQAFDTVRLHRAHSPIKRLPVWRGQTSEVPIGFPEDLILSLPRGRTTGLAQRLRYQENLQAPLRVGDPVGNLSVSLDGEPIGEYPVRILQDVPSAGWTGRLWDSIRLFLKNL